MRDLDEYARLHPQAVPTRINGRVFPSMAEAARQLGVSVEAVRNAVYAGRDTVHVGGKGWNRKAVTFEGRTYPSHRALARALGLKPKGVSEAIAEGRLERFVARNRRA